MQLIQEIEIAFKDVRLDNGIGIFSRPVSGDMEQENANCKKKGSYFIDLVR